MRICEVDGCGKPNYGHGMCRMHWARWYNAKSDTSTRSRCSVDGCQRICVGLGLCGLHYQRMRERGAVDDTQRALARKQRTVDGMRICFTCRRRLPRDEKHFGRRPGTSDGLKATCRECSYKASSRSMLKSRYGITQSDFDSMFSRQNGCCAVCQRPFEFMRSVKASSPHVDHDHNTGKVRGLLCHHCNVLIGHAEEKIERLSAAIKYLQTAA